MQILMMNLKRGVEKMRKTRLFLGVLLVVAMFAFVGCSNDNAAETPNGTNDTGIVNDNATMDKNAMDRTDNPGTDIGDGMRNMVDDIGDTMKDVATDGAVNDKNHNNQ